MEDIKFYELSNKRGGLPFGIFSSIEEGFRADDLYRPSLRDFHVILWFKKGIGKYFIDFKEYQFKPNTITLISKDQYHYLEPPAGNWEIQSIIFKNDFIYRSDNDLQHLFNFNISSQIEGHQILKLKQPEADFLKSLSSDMNMVYHEWSGSVRENAFYHWLCIFLIYCETLQEKQTNTQPAAIDGDTKIVIQFNKLLEKNFRKEFKVNYYVEQLNLTTRVLYRITKERYKLSPKAVIDERRILEIKRLLRASDKPVKEIAYDLGFDEPTNLVKYFKKHTGYTPLSFKTGG
ncbi:MAG: AraC family transcriptional regulator [Calditrichia bacterium]